MYLILIKKKHAYELFSVNLFFLLYTSIVYGHPPCTDLKSALYLLLEYRIVLNDLK